MHACLDELSSQPAPPQRAQMSGSYSEGSRKNFSVVESCLAMTPSWKMHGLKRVPISPRKWSMYFAVRSDGTMSERPALSISWAAMAKPTVLLAWLFPMPLRPPKGCHCRQRDEGHRGVRSQETIPLCPSA